MGGSVSFSMDVLSVAYLLIIRSETFTTMASYSNILLIETKTNKMNFFYIIFDYL